MCTGLLVVQMRRREISVHLLPIHWYSIPVISITLVAISFDRFLFIVKPHLHKRFTRPWVALTLTIAIWILSAVLGTLPFIDTGHYSYGD